MRPLPRLAVGTVQPDAQIEPIAWGLMAALHQAGHEIVHFRSLCFPAPHDAARCLTGSGSRHLDSWAMSRSACLRTMLRATAHSEVAIVEGCFDAAAASPADAATGSSLDRLCDWLDLPRIAVVDVSRLDPCHLPRRPARLDGLLLDGASGPDHAARWQTNLEALWKAPVLGWLDQALPLRALCRELPEGRDPSPELCAALGNRLRANLRLDKLLALADRTSCPAIPADDLHFELPGGRLRIAVAYDEDFCGYFPDTLDLLEEAGAELCDFSPLQSGALPDGADIVYLGCGHPERHPDQLAKNHCLQQSLRSFAATGGRIYAEGSGLAYLCRELQLSDGRRFPMSGLLPATAHQETWPAAPQPAEVGFRLGCWLVDRGSVLRGYRHPGWQIQPCCGLATFAQDEAQQYDVVGCGNVVGSRILVNLAANEHLMRHFVQRRTPASTSPRRTR